MRNLIKVSAGKIRTEQKREQQKKKRMKIKKK